jgi:tRNA(fMet)-specific endonuclease VapC
MNYLLDTNTCIRFLNGRSVGIRTKMLAISENQIFVSVITQAEMYFGSYKSQFPTESRRQQEEFFTRFVVKPFDTACADEYGKIRAVLEKQGNIIGGNDLLIATTALAYDYILVTHNTREFSRIEKLKTEDWEL